MSSPASIKKHPVHAGRISNRIMGVCSLGAVVIFAINLWL
jgi:hypothetical protein